MVSIKSRNGSVELTINGNSKGDLFCDFCTGIYGFCDKVKHDSDFTDKDYKRLMHLAQHTLDIAKDMLDDSEAEDDRIRDLNNELDKKTEVVDKLKNAILKEGKSIVNDFDLSQLSESDQELVKAIADLVESADELSEEEFDDKALDLKYMLEKDLLRKEHEKKRGE